MYQSEQAEYNDCMDLRTLDDNEIETLKKMAPQLSHSQLADYLGMSDNCLRRMFEREPELLAVYNKALLDASSRMISQLYANGMDGDFQSMKLWLSQRAGWTEKKQTEISGKDGQPLDTVWTVNIVSPKKRDK
jgi:hypothetical protein